jgi:hypothetical protein
MQLWLTVWQLPQTLIGRMYYACITTSKITCYPTLKLIHTTALKPNAGVSLGQYVFVGTGSNTFTTLHELGHTVQSNYYGWLYLPLIGLPSVIRAIVFKYQWKRDKWGNRNYYAIWFERQASLLGYVCFSKQII